MARKKSPTDKETEVLECLKDIRDHQDDFEIDVKFVIGTAKDALNLLADKDAKIAALEGANAKWVDKCDDLEEKLAVNSATVFTEEHSAREALNKIGKLVTSPRPVRTEILRIIQEAITG